MHYTILESSSKGVLERLVVEHLQSGYQLQGGVSAVKYGGMLLYVQAVYKKENTH